jgi:hypothetical protein
VGKITVSKDGQLVVLPWDEATGAQLKEQLNISPDRIPTICVGGRTKAVGDHELVKLQGGVYISDAPRFRYGQMPAVARRLALETEYVSQMYRQKAEFGFDPNLNRWWLYLPAFRLPPGWRQSVTPILVTVPPNYPAACPDGFFLSNELRDIHGRTPAHYFEQRSAHNPLTSKGWAWFCVHPVGWRPSYDIRDGDSVAKYLTLIHLVMSEVVAPDSIKGGL